jgi:hypothetical protein
VLYVGDEVVIPALEVHEIVRPTDQTHRLVVKHPPLSFRVILQDHNQLPYREQDYELTLTSDPHEQPRTGTTDSKGKLVEQLPLTARRVEVFLPKAQLRWTFKLDALLPIPSQESIEDKKDPATPELAIKALQMRLLSLGFPCGEVDGRLGAQTRAALALWRAGEANSTPAGQAEPPSDIAKPKVDHALLADVEGLYEVIA